MRTADLDGAHVEYFRGIRNPLAIKIGPATTPEMLRELLERLDPDDEPGRLTLIHRFGVGQIEQHLPPLVEAVRAPASGCSGAATRCTATTETTASGVKTRDFDDILGELERAFDIHAEIGTRLGGVHFELTGENVTECIGGARGLTEDDLSLAYRSHVDPRLNYEQALEMAMRIARRMGHERGLALARPVA